MNHHTAHGDMEGVSSWLGGHDWTSVESGSPTTSHCSDVILLASEDVIVEGRAVVLVNIDTPGTLLVTNFRLIFIGEGSKQVIALGTIPLATIEKFSKLQLRSSSAHRTRERGSLRRLLQIVGKDMRVCVFGFRPHSKQRRSIFDALLRVIRPLRLWDMYAFASHVPVFVGQTNTHLRLRSEYLRIIAGTSAAKSNGLGLQLEGHYRLSDANAEYNMCATYPSLFVAPGSISDEEVQHAAIFRSRGRVPALCWLHPENGAVLIRSSQPLIGIMMNSRSNADEKLVAAFCTSISNKHSQQRKLYIADARPRKNALANGAMGGGSESSANYLQSEVVFLGIDNIHAMRDSLGRLRDYVDLHGAASSDGSSSLQRTAGWGWGGGNLSSMTTAVSALGDSGWLMHIHGILAGAAWIAARISLEGASVLVHCSDGWDRTSQLISLAGLMLDPYYRTFQGFQALVEKDWLAFGHPFADRLAIPTFAGSCNPTIDGFRGPLSGSVGPSSPIRAAPGSSFTSSTSSQSHGALSSNYSPIFLQWLDCVAQLLRLYPRAFEFSSAYLVELLDCVLSCRFGNFLCNSEKERLHAGISKACDCIWKYLEDQRTKVGPEYHHFNPFYSSELHSGALLPPAASLVPVLWPHFHLRWACPSDMLTGYSTPSTWVQGGELEMQARLLARRVTSTEKGKENAEEKVKELMAGMQSLSEQLHAENEARKYAVVLAARARKEAAALRRAVETMGCKIRFINANGSTSQDVKPDCDIEISLREESPELPIFGQEATTSAGSSFEEQDQFSISVSLDSEADISADHFRRNRQQEYSTSCSKAREGCKWPQNGCSRMSSGLLGLRANFDALEQLSILDSYFDVEHVPNPSTYSYDNKSQHSSGVT